MSTVIEALRWIFIASCSLVFLGSAWVMSMGLRPGQSPDSLVGVLGWAWAITKYVLLGSGLLPLIVAVVWALRAHSRKYFGQGALIVVGLLAFHYFLFAVAAHSDRGYPWVQAGEFVLFGLAMWFLLKAPRVTFLG